MAWKKAFLSAWHRGDTSFLVWLRRVTLGVVSLLLAVALWVPSVHLLFVPADGEFRQFGELGRHPKALSPVARKLAARHIRMWNDAERKKTELDRMRITNPEWDFMGRTFLVMSLANMCLAEPAVKQTYLPLMDRIIEDTERLLAEKGNLYFLMDYAREGKFVQQPSRSIFIDGELAWMVAARQLVERKEFAVSLESRVEQLIARMRASPKMSCECYPDECWMFCNTVAAAAIKMHEVLDGVDHSDFLNEWLTRTKRDLTDPVTGILYSSYTYAGEPIDGPEGSTVWMAAHCLQIVDEAFARDQYERGRKTLRRSLWGFDWAREWPDSWRGHEDVDSGPVIPVFDVSAGSSGMAFLGAASFDDKVFYNRLATTLKLFAFPLERHGELKFCASNQVGDAVLLYSSVMGPLWEEVRKLQTARRK